MATRHSDPPALSSPRPPCSSHKAKGGTGPPFEFTLLFLVSESFASYSSVRVQAGQEVADSEPCKYNQHEAQQSEICALPPAPSVSNPGMQVSCVSHPGDQGSDF